MLLLRILLHLLLIAVLTVLTQIGGLVWLILWLLVRGAGRRVLAFAVLYPASVAATTFIAPSFGREALPCFEQDGLAPRSLIFCAFNRHYVTPELRLLAETLARDVDAEFPGAVTRYLDASFPFPVGLPLLPHLSHVDGRQLDLTFFYDFSRTVPGITPSPIGYRGALEPHAEDPAACRDPHRTPISFGLDWLAPFERTDHLTLDTERTSFMLRWLAEEAQKGGIETMLLDPDLRRRFALPPEVVRFPGCRAVPDPDHVHIEVR